MMLLIDAGNTRIKWALAADASKPGQWLDYGAVMHADAAQLADAWRAAFTTHAAQGHGAVTRVLAANVAGAAVREQLERMLAAAGNAEAIEWFASIPERAGVKNGYRNPGQLGCDRFAAAIGAHALAPGRAIIVANCGTATTIDAVTADGVFLGGMILPGLGLMATSLARNTAQLPQIAQGGPLPSGFADNTDDAILSGLLAAQAGAIEHACMLHQAEDCLISGGAAQYISPALTARVPHQLVDNIVLIGLHAAVVHPDHGGADLDRPC
ncbi:type III pantothenate kinase [Pseudoduganella namucuonensis]|uniref:Type III pantothenate kinase n=1 Tax=Pseudoduganella namucuonensis TaxID=1035707 RepID=A0A1I7ETG7_9BURK|nr:type III pantothenate kinase [Pseudoduganella namucuonensis]SFU27211.1 type III pantothenate kinase [Pseudoduganella namucuonensis]